MVNRAISILVVLTLLSGIIKVIGIRMEFMRITHVGFDDWKITVFGIAQVASANPHFDS